MYECGAGRYRDSVPRRLVREDGKEIVIPSEKWFENHPETTTDGVDVFDSYAYNTHN